MEKTPKSLRLHIGLFGRTNVGKSSFLNYIAGQDVAITSPIPGTTTDVVEKVMELLPIGPVVFLDTAGLDDRSVLAEARLKKTRKVFDRSDIIVLVAEAGRWESYEEQVLTEAKARSTPVILVVNKVDAVMPDAAYLEKARVATPRLLMCSCLKAVDRDRTVAAFKKFLIEIAPEDYLDPPSLIGDLIPKGGLAVLVMPIDLEAPKGRLILPQVQTLRDVLDHDAASLVVKEHELAAFIARLKQKPDIVVCDSQAVEKVVADSPPDVWVTTFSILLVRSKGDLVEAARSAAVLKRLKPGDKVLIAEACSHHAIEGDIGRVKIPRWLDKSAGFKVTVDVVSGRDFPATLKDYRIVIHCGACMFNRREMLARVEVAKGEGVALTNYGIAIAVLQGVAERVLAPFPAALAAYRSAL